MLSRTYERGGCEARYSLSLVREYAFFSTWTPQKEALLRDSSGRDGKIIFKHFGHAESDFMTQGMKQIISSLSP